MARIIITIFECRIDSDRNEFVVTLINSAQKVLNIKLSMLYRSS